MNFNTKSLFLSFFLTVFISLYLPCHSQSQYIKILGIAQDGGIPHIGCKKVCCNSNKQNEKVVCLGLIDKHHKKKYLFEATPDLTAQIKQLNEALRSETLCDGIFITHAHMGHYTGLMYLGREALGAKNIPVYLMPKMKQFIETNGPWSQLVTLKNIEIKSIQNETDVVLTNQLTVTPFIVPHRDEFSETIGYKFQGQKKSALFIPDINKWSLWNKDLVDEVKKVDYAFIDATFASAMEINRPIEDIPHPLVSETVRLFYKAARSEITKVIFIHFNHTNALINENNKERLSYEKLGFRFAKEGDTFYLD
jgi:pyrroloquinoline quinone biosynthesis protein B